MRHALTSGISPFALLVGIPTSTHLILPYHSELQHPVTIHRESLLPVTQKASKAKRRINRLPYENESFDCLNPTLPKPNVNRELDVINRSALKLPQPKYPLEATQANITGEVRVRVIVDHTGRVIWARIESGHTLLQAEVSKVVCRARFAELCVGPPVRISGVLIYRFPRGRKSAQQARVPKRR